MRLTRAYLSSFAFLLLFIPPAAARRIESWPYERLFKEADLVLIASAEGTVETKERFQGKLWKIELIGQETTLTVRGILKGDAKKETQIKVLHYRLPEGIKVESGPMLVTFRTQPLALNGTLNGRRVHAELAKPDYLLFLRSRPDGRYEPISGHIDPALSIRVLSSALGFLSSLDRK